MSGSLTSPIKQSFDPSTDTCMFVEVNLGDPLPQVPKSEHGMLSLDAACKLLGNDETAYHALVARGRVKAGETVLVHGASGATGLAAVEIAKLLGAKVISTGRSDEKLAKVKARGPTTS